MDSFFSVVFVLAILETGPTYMMCRNVAVVEAHGTKPWTH
jgi:hypothetical protein